MEKLLAFLNFRTKKIVSNILLFSIRADSVVIPLDVFAVENLKILRIRISES